MIDLEKIDNMLHQRLLAIKSEKKIAELRALRKH